MIFNEEVPVSLLVKMYPALATHKNLTEKIISEVLQKDGEYVTRTTNFRKSQAAKQSWRKNRDTYQMGINRFHRNNKVTDVRKKLAGGLKNWGKVSPFKANDSDSDKLEHYVVEPKGHFDLYEFLGDLALLESHVHGMTGTMTLEDTYVESAILSDRVLEDMSVIRDGVLNKKPIPAPVMETLLALILDANDSVDKNATLCESFFKSNVPDLQNTPKKKKTN